MSAGKRWVVDLPTRVHLWCAEHELRLADTAGLSATIRGCRQENLARLRAYRVSRQFPRNRTRATTTYQPVFIDDEGRHCAIAHLMSCTGDGAEARRIAGTQNRARVRQMELGVLMTWAAGTGLTPKELARIQPTYPPESPEAPWFQYAVLSLPILLLLGVALTARNLICLTTGSVRAFAARLGASVAVVAVCVGLLVQNSGHEIPNRMNAGINTDPYEFPVLLGKIAVVVGGLCGLAGLGLSAAVHLRSRRPGVKPPVGRH